jgi:uncharacterized protein (TIGR03083 family)
MSPNRQHLLSGHDDVGRVNSLLVNALRLRSTRATSARALASVPDAAQLLRYVDPPAQDAFIAFATTLGSTDFQAETRCEGWTVHELTAHIAAGSAEIADLIELELAAGSTRPTRDFDEREAPYRALSPKALYRAFFREALRATVAVERLSRSGAARGVTFTGTTLDADTLILHIESELVLHRWDIVGSDATSVKALSDPRLAVHAAKTVIAMQPNVFPPRSGERETIVLRTLGAPDIAVTGGGLTSIEVAPAQSADPVVHCEPAVRTLLLWGRTPEPELLPSPVGEPDVVKALTTMLHPDGRGYGAL